MSFKDFNFARKRVLLREDFNVPLDSGAITDATRIDVALPTIRYLIDQQAQVILLSHLGRPTEGQFDTNFSLKPIADYLQQQLSLDIPLVSLGGNMPPATVVLLENVRFNVGEKANDDHLAQQYAALGDVFVMDAFAVSHRAQASTVGISGLLSSVAGPLLEQEVTSITQALAAPKRPVVAIVGGSKVSTKLAVLENLIACVDTLVVGGGIANTFLAAKGINIGNSLFEQDLVPVAKKILQRASSSGKTIWLPTDVTVADSINASTGQIKPVEHIEKHEAIFDIGPDASKELAQLMQNAQTILWNGPVGVFEKPAFSTGTQALTQAIANSAAFSIAGGGDTIAAINQFGAGQAINLISTGGGAFLELLEGKALPAVSALQSMTDKESLWH